MHLLITLQHQLPFGIRARYHEHPRRLLSGHIFSRSEANISHSFWHTVISLSMSNRCVPLLASIPHEVANNNELIIAPAATAVGRSVEVTGKYLPQAYIGWPMCMIGFGIISLLDAQSSTVRGECLQIVLAIGLGFLYVAPQFCVLAPLEVSDNASALALMSWFRTFGQ